MTRLTRRLYVLAIAGAISGLAVGGRRRGQATVESALAGVVPHDSAVAVGTAFLDASAAGLDNRIAELGLTLARLGLDGASSIDVGTLKRRLSQLVREDFRGGRIVRVANWHLALAEVHVCALIALGNSAHWPAGADPGDRNPTAPALK